jgi:mannose-1-phosphate guanylyltransferase
MESTPKTDIKIVLFCGGRGTRMWPISKVGHPKQFDAILGKQSFFRQSLERVLKCVTAKDIFVSTGTDFKQVIIEQAPEIPAENIILEPEMRDTLGAVALATATINHKFPNSVMIILWGADHLVQKEERFIEALKKSAQLAHDNNVIVHIDMKPSYPSVHNGWIQIGKKLKTEDSFDIYEFIKQVEKPDLVTAQKFFESGSYLIHSGYMATKPALLLEKYQKYAPECYKVIEKIIAVFDSDKFEQVLKEEYPKIEKNSVDFGVFEKLKPGSQWELPVDIGWVDLGTWELLYHGLPKDKAGNVHLGKVEFMETKNSLVFSRDNKIVGVIGLEEVIVVDTPEGLLVCSLAKAPLVKELYKKIFGK